MRQGDIYICDLPIMNAEVIGGKRPCVIISNDYENSYSSRVVVVPITSKIKRLDLPYNVELNLEFQSMAVCNQIMTLSKNDVKEYKCRVDKEKLKEIRIAVLCELGCI